MSNRASKIKKKPNKPLMVISEKQSLFRLALVRRLWGRKIGTFGKRAAGKTRSGEARGWQYRWKLCAPPPGESLINSGLLRYLTESKDEKKKKEKR